MKVCILASGSSGNCTYIQVNNHNILIDAGISFKEIKEKLDSIDVKIEDIDTILVTHAHIDHTVSLDKLYNKIHPNIYMTNDIYMEIKENIRNLIDYKDLKEELIIDDIYIKPFKTSHDTKDSKGYLIEYNNKSLVYITDTGYINNKYLKMLENKNIYIMESNHDPSMLMHGIKPHNKKERVYSDTGHLCNSQAAYYLSLLVGNNTTNIFLAHISRHDNTKELAYNETKDILNRKNKNIPKIEIADQKEMSSVVVI